jgi:hypothetical protein
MMDRNLDYLLDACQDRIEMLSEAISLGNCMSYDEYKFACGQIRGLEAACGIIKDLISNLETADD